MADDRLYVAKVGTQLGRYTVLKPLVQGGITEVLLARATGSAGFQHHVVIKCIHAHRSTDPRFVQMFLDEARLAASLHHHHIVQVHDVGRDGDDYFFAMEYVHGENLRRLLTQVARQKVHVPLEQILTIVIAVAAGLHYAHEQRGTDGEPLGLVHRDVTPANILIGYDGNVKVTDFGIAKAMFKSTELTKSGQMRGKVSYMSPEQCLGRPVDRRSDIFALGIVLYELCTSRRLFKDDNDFMVMSSIVNGKIPTPTQHRTDLPLDLEDVILKALAPKPDLRYATAEDLALALEKVAIDNTLRLSSAALSDYVMKTFGRRQEPWLVDSGFELVDVDFDGRGGSGLVTLAGDDEGSNPTIERELLGSPVLAAFAGDDPNEFADAPKTEIQDPDEPPTLSGSAGAVARAEALAARLLAGRDQPATSGFEGGERTIIGEEDDLDMLRGLSKIDGLTGSRPTVAEQPPPTPFATPPATPFATAPPTTRGPMPLAVPQAPIPLRGDATPIPQPRGDATPNPQPPVPLRGDATPIPRGDATPLPNRSMWGLPDGSGHLSVTGTPMAWVHDGDVPSLAPKGRRVMLIAAIAIPLIVIGVFLLTRGSGGSSGARAIEPDAFDAAGSTIDAPTATPLDAAVTAKPPGDARAPAGTGSAARPTTGVAPPPRPVVKLRPSVGGKPAIKKQPPPFKR